MNPWVLSWAGFAHALSTPLRAIQAHRLVRGECFVSLVIDGAVVEVAEPAPFWRRSSMRTTSLAHVRQLGSIILRDGKVKGLIVELRSLRAGSATVTSLREALVGLKEAGKKVVVYLPMGAGSREMLIASAASSILMGPASSILPLGIAVEARYFRRALDKAGILPEIFARGEFKTAGESLVRNSMSAEQRQQLEAILDTLESELLAGISEGRRLSIDQVRALIDGSPYRARDAVERALIDDVSYDDELPNLLAAPAREPVKIVSSAAYLHVRRPPSAPKRIGIVHVRGPIVSRGPLAFGRMAVEPRVIGALRRAGAAKRVLGVVILIDSPGGSVLASDRIYHEVVRLAEKKPVVAYFGNVAASGGYYVAAGAHAIVAQPTTITGSIGVVAAHLVLSPLLEKLGIVTEHVKRGARADMLSSTRALDESERQAMTLEIDGHYRDFVDIVARGRQRSPDEIEKLARGRVYSGLEAHRVGLVDRLGNLDAALDLVRERLGVDESMAPVVIKPPRTIPKPPQISAPFVQALEAFESTAAFYAVGGQAARDLAVLALNVVPGERVLAWSDLVAPE